MGAFLISPWCTVNSPSSCELEGFPGKTLRGRVISEASSPLSSLHPPQAPALPWKTARQTQPHPQDSNCPYHQILCTPTPPLRYGLRQGTGWGHPRASPVVEAVEEMALPRDTHMLLGNPVSVSFPLPSAHPSRASGLLVSTHADCI